MNIHDSVLNYVSENAPNVEAISTGGGFDYLSRLIEFESGGAVFRRQVILTDPEDAGMYDLHLASPTEMVTYENADDWNAGAISLRFPTLLSAIDALNSMVKVNLTMPVEPSQSVEGGRLMVNPEGHVYNVSDTTKDETRIRDVEAGYWLEVEVNEDVMAMYGWKRSADGNSFYRVVEHDGTQGNHQILTAEGDCAAPAKMTDKVSVWIHCPCCDRDVTSVTVFVSLRWFLENQDEIATA